MSATKKGNPNFAKRIALLAGSTALALSLCFAPKPAEAAFRATSTVSVESAGFGRLVLNFAPSSSAPTFSTEQFNGIFVVTFEDEVDVETSQILRRLRRYASVIRISDDKRSLRFGLTRGVRVNMTPAAERLYLDFLPETWTGEPPLLPQDVIVELARRAEDALKAQRLAEARLRDDFVNPDLTVAVGRHPTFTRLELMWNIEFRSKIVKSENEIGFIFDVLDNPDLAPINANPPALVESISSDQNSKETRVTIKLVPGVEVRTYREDNAMVVDLTTKELKEKNGVDYLTGLKGEKPALAFEAPQDTSQASLERPLTVEPKAKPQNSSETNIIASDGALQTDDGIIQTSPVRDPLQQARPEQSGTLEGLAETGVRQGVVAVAASRSDEATELLFPFVKEVAASVFQRGNTLWMVFDDASEYDLRAFDTVFGEELRRKSVFRLGANATAIRLVFSRPGVVGVTKRGTQWSITHGDSVRSPSRPVAFERGLDDRGRSVMRAQYADGQNVHRFIDPGVGDEIVVVTGYAPVRGIVRKQAFVEFQALTSTQGLAFVPLADGVDAALSASDVMISRDGLGLRLSRGRSYQPLTQGADGEQGIRVPGTFGTDFVGSVPAYHRKLAQLENDFSLADRASRGDLHKELIRFFLANDRAIEALGNIGRYAQTVDDAETDPDLLILKGAAELLSGRNDDALKTLSTPQIDKSSESAFWKTIAAAENSDWETASTNAELGQRALAGYPVDIQKKFHFSAAEAAINRNKHANAAEALAVIAGSEINQADKAKYFILRAKLADAAGRRGDAVTALEYVLRTGYKPGIARAKFELAQIDYRDNAAAPEELINRMEDLVASWRGDQIELKVRRNLSRLYVQQNDHRQAFETLASAMALAPDDDVTRSMHNEMQDVFASIFSDQDQTSMPPLKAVSLFYDFRKLLPVGRSGDELVRNLANNLIDLDLLDKAAEVLVHQVDHRLQGAAKAQIAADASAIYLMNSEPHKALNLLRRTQQSRLPQKLTRQRRLVESVALSEVGRMDVALELLAGVDGPDAESIRADMFWKSARYREAAESYEATMGNRWATGGALSDEERAKIMRAAIAHSLDQNEVGLEELRQKYGELMSQSPDAVAFDVLAAPASQRGAQFDAVASAVKSIRSIQGFMDDYRKRYMQSPLLDEEEKPQLQQQANLDDEDTDPA